MLTPLFGVPGFSLPRRDDFTPHPEKEAPGLGSGVACQEFLDARCIEASEPVENFAAARIDGEERIGIGVDAGHRDDVSRGEPQLPVVENADLRAAKLVVIAL